MVLSQMWGSLTRSRAGGGGGGGGRVTVTVQIKFQLVKVHYQTYSYAPIDILSEVIVVYRCRCWQPAD